MPKFVVDFNVVNKVIHMIWEFEDAGCTPFNGPK